MTAAGYTEKAHVSMAACVRVEDIISEIPSVQRLEVVKEYLEKFHSSRVEGY